MNKNILSIVILSATLAACATHPQDGSQVQVIAQSGGRSDPSSRLQLAPGVHFGGGDGSSMPQAVSVLGATERTGVDAEYIWLHQRFPGYGKVRQSLLQKETAAYDVLEFTTPDGAQHTVYFDITDYFGKMG